MLFNLSSHIWVQNSHQPWVILTQLQTTRPRSIINQTLNIHVQQNSSVAVRNFNTLMDLYATSLSSDAKNCYQSLFLGYWNYVISWTSLHITQMHCVCPKNMHLFSPLYYLACTWASTVIFKDFQIQIYIKSTKKCLSHLIEPSHWVFLTLDVSMHSILTSWG